MLDSVRLLVGSVERAAWTIGVTALLVGTGLAVSLLCSALPSLLAAIASLASFGLMLGMMYLALMGLGNNPTPQ
jgi:hypothetical protein